MRMPDSTHALRDGTMATEPDGKRARIVVEEIGDLILTTGRIVACDPFCIAGYDDILPYTVPVTPTRYRVSLSIARFTHDDERWPLVTCAMLRFSEREPVRWEIAQLAPSLNEDKQPWRPGYYVDAGTGCFADVVAAQALKRWLEADASNHDEMVMLFYSAHEAGREWMQIRPDPALKANVIMFDSGWGDDMYYSYFGYDDAGKVACLMTDFGVFDDGTIFE